MEALKVARFLNLFAVAAVAGAFFAVRFGYSPTMRTLAPVPYAQVQQGLSATLRVRVPIAMGAALVTSLAVLVLQGEVESEEFFLTLFGFAATLVAAVASWLVNVPIEREVLTWNPKGPPANWFVFRDRWEEFHTLRAVLGVLALAAHAAAAVF